MTQQAHFMLYTAESTLSTRASTFSKVFDESDAGGGGYHSFEASLNAFAADLYARARITKFKYRINLYIDYGSGTNGIPMVDLYLFTQNTATPTRNAGYNAPQTIFGIMANDQTIIDQKLLGRFRPIGVTQVHDGVSTVTTYMFSISGTYTVPPRLRKNRTLFASDEHSGIPDLRSNLGILINSKNYYDEYHWLAHIEFPNVIEDNEGLPESI